MKRSLQDGAVGRRPLRARTEAAYRPPRDAHKPFVAWMAEGADLLSEVFAQFVEHDLALYKNLSAKSLEDAVQACLLR